VGEAGDEGWTLERSLDRSLRARSASASRSSWAPFRGDGLETLEDLGEPLAGLLARAGGEDAADRRRRSSAAGSWRSGRACCAGSAPCSSDLLDLAVFRERPLEGRYPYVWLDAHMLIEATAQPRDLVLARCSPILLDQPVDLARGDPVDAALLNDGHERPARSACAAPESSGSSFRSAATGSPGRSRRRASATPAADSRCDA
jgi:hypothetical protein